MAEKLPTYYGTGRRKTAVAKVWIQSGDGKIEINGRVPEKYFSRASLEQIIQQPLSLTKREGNMDVKAKVLGGGLSGQAEALRLGLARALVRCDSSLSKPLREKGFLTRDSRAKERKKYGQKGARKRFQFSKR